MGVPSVLFVCGLVIVTIMCKALGATTLLFGAFACLAASRLIKSKALLYVMVITPIVYVVVRTPGIWDGEPFLSIAAIIDEDRAQSLGFRFEQENQLAAKAMQRPVFGWGGWGRNRVVNDDGENISVTDGLWIIAFGVSGIVGLSGFLGMQIVPSLLTIAKQRRDRLGIGTAWPAMALMLPLFIFSADSLLNAMPNPVFILGAGALVSASMYKEPSVGRSRKRSRRAAS